MATTGNSTFTSAVATEGGGVGRIRSAICASRSSSSGRIAAKISSPSKFRLRTSLSLNPNGSEEKASIRPTTRVLADKGTAIMDRVPRSRQACAFTRASLSESSQRTVCPLRRHAPENPELGSRRTPGGGAIRPTDARQTMALSSAIAMATPSAPVMEIARAATSRRTSSSANSSSLVISVLVESLPLRLAACSWMQANANRACSASRPLLSPRSASGGPEGGVLHAAPA